MVQATNYLRLTNPNDATVALVITVALLPLSKYLKDQSLQDLNASVVK